MDPELRLVLNVAVAPFFLMGGVKLGRDMTLSNGYMILDTNDSDRVPGQLVTPELLEKKREAQAYRLVLTTIAGLGLLSHAINHSDQEVGILTAGGAGFLLGSASIHGGNALAAHNALRDYRDMKEGQVMVESVEDGLLNLFERSEEKGTV